jgi:hypothetical protein
MRRLVLPNYQLTLTTLAVLWTDSCSSIATLRMIE